MADTVVCLHGWWMPTHEVAMVRNRLAKVHGFDARLFGYPSILRTLDESAHSLIDYLKSLNADPVHLVGHSLGGIVALRALTLAPDLPAGRVVCLGSPLRGSKAAQSLHRFSLGRLLLGRALPDATLRQSTEAWATAVVMQRDVGVVAGRSSTGMGRFFARFDESNDGTVAVAETRLGGITDHIVLDVSHTGMVFSRRVADQAAHFLAAGQFLRSPE